MPPELRGHRGGAARYSDDSIRNWSRALYDAGYIGLTWPKEYGGGGKPYSYQAIYLEETARAEAPQHLGVIGLGMAGPTIIALGTEAQKARYLQPLLAADEIWCQGFSEPGAGSDLSAVRTSARLEGSHFVVDGQKVWSSYAHIADWCILVTRSDPASVRHAGLTYLIVDMKAPGVEVRPLRQITGEAEFNEIFFTGVEVPVENVIGEVGGGWQVAMTTLLHERGTLGFALTAALEVMVGKLIELARDRGATPLQRDAIAREWIELQALRYTAYRSLSALMKTGIPGPEGSILKQQWSEAAQRLTKLALELLGPDAQLLADNAPYGGYWQHMQLRSRGNTIEAGTSEILRNIIAERVLGLPRSASTMDFAFTPEQEELRAQARPFLAANPEPSWQELAELGWTGVSVAEENGGAGLGFLEEAILFEEMGRALTHAPYWSTVAVTLPALPADLQSEVASGAASWTLATGPLVADLDTATRVAYVGGDTIWELEGFEREVLQTNDETRPLGVVSGGEAGRELASSELLPQIRSRSLTALALEACGVGARALELAVAYAGEREQFGKPIGTYQAISHPLATTLMELELGRSLALFAAWCISEDDDRTPIAAASAKSLCADAAVAACERSIQVHGGIGFTWEHVLHRLYKRALWIQSWEASGAQLRSEVAAHLLDGDGG